MNSRPNQGPRNQNQPYPSQNDRGIPKDFVLRTNSLTPIYENTHLFDNNQLLGKNSLPYRIVKSATLIDNELVILFEGCNFLMQFQLPSRKFVERQRFVAADINEAVVSLQTGRFGQVADFPCSAFSYVRFNEVMLSNQ